LSEILILLSLIFSSSVSSHFFATFAVNFVLSRLNTLAAKVANEPIILKPESAPPNFRNPISRGVQSKEFAPHPPGSIGVSA
jgi:hypothetical protein